MSMSLLTGILKDLKSGNTKSITIDNSIIINNATMDLLKLSDHSIDQIVQMGMIVGVSNILYNNTDRVVLPLEDGVYDLLLSLYKKYNPAYQIGAEPIHFESSNIINSTLTHKGLIDPIKRMKNVDDFIFYEDLSKTPKLSRDNYLVSPILRNTEANKKVVNVEQQYPKLVGTLDKCKFVLSSQAIERGVYEDLNVEIFERDFIQQHIRSGILDPKRKFYMVLELKVDGVSVVATVNNTILDAFSRGDTNNNTTADLSPIFRGYRFRGADAVPTNNVFGMKFEAILTYENLFRLSQFKGKDYKNCRNAVVGLLGSLDGHSLRDYITLIPLATSLEVDRLTEIEFMNKYYNSGEFLRYSVVYGDYKEILFQVKKFVEEAEYMRNFLPYMYDGVVASYIEPDLIDNLGRQNSVNKYSVAIKFNAMKKQTIFLGYTYTVGSNGTITPMIHYNPVEFYGTIHTKSTGHSYKRFVELSLKQGDIVSIEYTNDVMPYVTKLDLDDNLKNPNPIIQFIDVCPSCGNTLKGSDSGKSMVCDNMSCPERNIARMVSMLQKLELKDFSEETLKTVAKFSLSELFDLTIEDVRSIGNMNAQKFIQRIRHLKEIPIYDYKIVGSLGFTSIGREKWKLILSVISLNDVIFMPDESLKQILVTIRGIGPIAADTICTEKEFFMNDLMTINNMKNIIHVKGKVTTGKSIRFSGTRDKDLTDTLNSMGHDANENAGVTKTTDILVIPYETYTSSKTSKVGPNTIIVTLVDFKENMDVYLGGSIV